MHPVADIVKFEARELSTIFALVTSCNMLSTFCFRLVKLLSLLEQSSASVLIIACLPAPELQSVLASYRKISLWPACVRSTPIDLHFEMLLQSKGLPLHRACVSRGQVDVNPVDQQVEMWLRSKTDLSLPGISVAEGERLLVEVSRKFTAQRLASLAYKSGLSIQVRFAEHKMYDVLFRIKHRHVAYSGHNEPSPIKLHRACSRWLL